MYVCLEVRDEEQVNRMDVAFKKVNIKYYGTNREKRTTGLTIFTVWKLKFHQSDENGIEKIE